MKEMSLARQVEFVFRQLENELTGACAGTVLLQVRNNVIGKFGVKHHPITLKDNEVQAEQVGLTRDQVVSFRGLAIEALKLKRSWTHGEILYDFSVKPNRKGWSASVLYESNYNMSNWNSSMSTFNNRKNVMDYSS
ncbi:O-methyltransferase [Paenibacillus septentrionalis]|uniref:O-methyltransferase n=2 Tax=Paenibacillus septentrionalis TaxID=429342 RepID=A0ABW1V8K4_9BACL